MIHFPVFIFMTNSHINLTWGGRYQNFQLYSFSQNYLRATNLIWKCGFVCVFRSHIKPTVCKEDSWRCLGNVCCDIYFSSEAMPEIFHSWFWLLMCQFQHHWYHKGIYLIFGFAYGICCHYKDLTPFLASTEQVPIIKYIQQFYFSIMR